MSLDTQIEKARKEISSDGYDMSIGEIMNLYKDDELIIHPEYQRLFRWDTSKKTRFIESLLLGIPIPPIFVFQTEKGLWELIDGLQRLSTVFEFAGILKNRRSENSNEESAVDQELSDANNLTGNPEEHEDEIENSELEIVDDHAKKRPATLTGTTFLPDLAGRAWDDLEGGARGIGKVAQLTIKRSRLRVEILKKESDPSAKYELFQRLNTGGEELTEQEVRNCTALMINPDFYRWLVLLARSEKFVRTTAQTEVAKKKQMGNELVLRFLAFLRVAYVPGLDVHEYLDDALIRMAKDTSFPLTQEKAVFDRTFDILDRALGDNAFKRWNGTAFSGMFLMSLFEVIATGVAQNIDAIESLGEHPATTLIVDRAKALWDEPIFQRNSGAGIRGTTRLANLLPMAKEHFQP